MTSASSGREALALLERGTEFNLLLTDVMMPDVDGPALLHRVREDPILHEMPVVMMSSNEHADVVLNCLRLGAEDYLLKPVTKKAVKHMWAHVWRRKQRNQMVPRFENGAEVVDEDEFDERMAAGDLAVTRTTSPGGDVRPDEFSSDGGRQRQRRAVPRGGRRRDGGGARATGLRHEREFVANFGADAKLAPGSRWRWSERVSPRGRGARRRRSCRTPVPSTERHDTCRRVRRRPTRRTKERKKKTETGSTSARRKRGGDVLADPPRARPGQPGALRRLAPLAPIEGLAGQNHHPRVAG